MKAAGLVDTLKGAGPFTVFAPTNEAVARSWAKGKVEDMLMKPENKDKLKSISCCITSMSVTRSRPRTSRR